MNIREAWEQTYIKEDNVLGGRNPHKVFAERTGLPYQEAKAQCYKEFYCTPFLAQVAFNLLTVGETQ